MNPGRTLQSNLAHFCRFGVRWLEQMVDVHKLPSKVCYVVIFVKICCLRMLMRYNVCMRTAAMEKFSNQQQENFRIRSILHAKIKKIFINVSDVIATVLVQMKADQLHLYGFWCFFTEIMLDLMNIFRLIVRFC